MDNSPLWDEALARIALAAGGDSRRTSASTPRSWTRRSGRRTPSTTGTPTSSVLYREPATTRRAIREESPFAMQARALQLAARAGRTRPRGDRARRRRGPEPYRRAGQRRRREPRRELWDDERGDVPRLRRACRTAHAGARPGPGSRRSTAASPSRERARSAWWNGSRPFAGRGGGGAVAVEPAPSDPRLRAGALLARAGLADDELGHPPRAATATASPSRRGRSARAQLELPRRSGFWEHYNPVTGEGHGGRRTSPGRPRSCSTLLGYGHRAGRRTDGRSCTGNASRQTRRRTKLRTRHERHSTNSTGGSGRADRPSYPARPRRRGGRAARGGGLLTAAAPAAPADAGNVTSSSTQFARSPRGGLPQQIVKGFPGKVDEIFAAVGNADVRRPDQGGVGRRQGHGQPPRRRSTATSRRSRTST